jgi:hypothetical protein
MSIEEEYFNQANQRLTQSETQTNSVELNENSNITEIESNCESLEYQELEQFEECNENDELEDVEENEDDIFYFKYEFEGCKTIDDILSNLDRLKEMFENLKNDGYKLREDVNSGYCFLYKE